MSVRVVSLVLVIACASAAWSAPADDPDELYRDREDLASASKAADLWAEHSATDYDAAWKLARDCYWLGAHLPERSRRAALDRGVKAGEDAIRLRPDRPEGHFWLAANMGRLAESFGMMEGLKYRGRIKDELERALAIQPGWEGGSGDAALGEWYAEVPRLFGGSTAKAEAHLRTALAYDPQNLEALVTLARVLADHGKQDEARQLLERVLAAPVSVEWGPEDREFKRQAAERLQVMRAAH